jgi:hypothetical protein
MGRLGEELTLRLVAILSTLNFKFERGKKATTLPKAGDYLWW